MRLIPFETCLALGMMFCVAGTSGCSDTVASPPSNPAPVAIIMPYLSLSDAETGAHARDDFYGYVNASWLKNTEIPSDQRVWGPVSQLQADTQQQLQRLIESFGSHPADKEMAKVVQLYSSFLDEDRAERLGVYPIKSEWTRIGALGSAAEIPALIAHFNQIDVPAPYDISIHQDARNSTRYVIDIQQSGLGLPNRDLYIAKESRNLRERYQRHIESMMRLAGDTQAAQDAPNIMMLETALANAQWPPAASLDPVKLYNKYNLADLPGIMRDYDWPLYLKAAGVAGKIDFLVISQPSYLTALGILLRDTPLPVWRSYFKWRLLSAMAPYLSKPLVDEQFAFDGMALGGIQQNESRSLRGVSLVNELIGEALSQVYVKQYLPSKRKDAVEAMVQVVLAAYRTRIKTLDWMSPDTQKAAQKKLNSLVLKIGAPAQYRDYGKLRFDENDLVGNVTAARLFEYQRNVAKLGKPIDRDEWRVLPQALSPYYDPQLNEIALPAVVLQPPFFDEKGDMAVNYGGIGVVIARQISRAFDAVGSQFDAGGRLQDWLTGKDRDHLHAKMRALAAQYAAARSRNHDSLPLEESSAQNLADNVGLAIAYQAFHLGLRGQEAPDIGGLTGDQRFFARFSQLWRSKARDDEMVERAMNGPAPPAAIRVNTPLMNQRAFYAAYGLEAGDQMFLAPGKRVELWQSP